VLETLAQSPPGDLAELKAVDGVRDWRAQALGEDLLKALGSTSAKS